MAAQINTPEGVEIGFKVYLTSPSTGVNTVVTVFGKVHFTAEDVAAFDVAGLAASLSEIAPDFQAMTREEITAYKADEDAD